MLFPEPKNPLEQVLNEVADGRGDCISDELKEASLAWVDENCLRPVQREGRRIVPKGPTDGPATNVVYYVRFCCRIKIGTTTNLTNRMLHIPHDSILATEPGGESVERMRHYQFEQYAIGGEWFKMAPPLLAHIRSLRAGTPELRKRLVSTRDAMVYTGRDRHTLYRWADEGKITKYVLGNGAGWDVLELPAHNPVEARKLPPCDV